LSNPDEAQGWSVRCVGIPASIDNDIALTGLAIGVDTAMNTIVEACDRIADTASAHDRTFIVEVMGRDCGYLAMTSAIASGANMVLFPEAARTEEDLVSAVVKTILTIRERHPDSHKVVAIKAEGVPTPTERLKSLVDAQLCERTGHDLPAVLSATKELLEGQSPLARWRATAFDDLEDVFLL
jgi:6-phosphofructokinase 1